jgi:TetR/AcrR family transcriptional regulator, cholesterol catabolism regulator
VYRYAVLVQNEGMPTDVMRNARQRILIAAVEILSDDNAASRLSVRAVATRANVSVGSLRHHFPTQRMLRDAALQAIYDVVVPAAPIDDTSIPAHDRLVASLRTILDTGGHASRARASIASIVESFVIAEQTEELREAYLAIVDEGVRRIEGWLTALAGQGELPLEHVADRAQFLDTVLNGITLQRALPVADDAVRVEERTLRLAVDATLRP